MKDHINTLDKFIDELIAKIDYARQRAEKYQKDYKYEMEQK